MSIISKITSLLKTEPKILMPVSDFVVMMTTIDKFNITNKRLPAYYTWSNGGRIIPMSSYKDMDKRVTNFKKNNKNRLPRTVQVLVSSPIQKQPSKSVKMYASSKTQYLLSISDSLGKPFNNFTEYYNLIKYRGYSYYYNDKYDQKTAISRLKNKLGLNCSDICQLSYQVAKDLGYSVRYVHIKCASGNGHIQLDIKSKEFGDKWVRLDPAAALKSGYKLGDLWCSTGKVIGFDDPWLRSDDGKT